MNVRPLYDDLCHLWIIIVPLTIIILNITIITILTLFPILLCFYFIMNYISFIRFRHITFGIPTTQLLYFPGCLSPVTDDRSSYKHTAALDRRQ